MQAFPHAPQFALSLLMSTHTPLPGTHSGRVGRHVHAEAVQVAPD
jgi:hypothetical protein